MYYIILYNYINKIKRKQMIEKFENEAGSIILSETNNEFEAGNESGIYKFKIVEYPDDGNFLKYINFFNTKKEADKKFNELRNLMVKQVYGDNILFDIYENLKT
jgi:hypothetical protein